ncbi:MAG: hypothetical protein ACOC85_04915 [Thermoplasmatota archaeon]
MRKIPLSLIILGTIVVGFGAISVAVMTNIITPRDIFTGFYTFVFALVLITILAIIGAIFVGIFISHRVFSSRQFTTFEEEMLRMKDDVEYIKEEINKIKIKKEED